MKKTCVVPTTKRRSLLPAPKSSSTAASKTSEVHVGKTRETSVVSPSDIQLTFGNVETAELTAGDSGNGNKHSVVAVKSVVGEPRQTQLRKPLNLRRTTAAGQRPSSASSVLNSVGRQVSLTKTSQNSGNSLQATAAKGPAGDVDKRGNVKRKDGRSFRGAMTATVPTNHPASSDIKQKHVQSTDAAAKKCLPDGAVTVTTSSAQHDVPEVALSGPRDLEDLHSDCASGIVVEESERWESLSDTVTLAGVPDVLSQLTADASSSGSLGLLDDSELLNTSLVSLDSTSAPSTTRLSNPPDDDDDDDDSRLPGMESLQVRPVSLMSDSSTDVGIVPDVTESRCEQDRPSSYVSTSSADTGL